MAKQALLFLLVFLIACSVLTSNVVGARYRLSLQGSSASKSMEENGWDWNPYDNPILQCNNKPCKRQKIGNIVDDAETCVHTAVAFCKCSSELDTETIDGFIPGMMPYCVLRIPTGTAAVSTKVKDFNPLYSALPNSVTNAKDFPSSYRYELNDSPLKDAIGWTKPTNDNTDNLSNDSTTMNDLQTGTTSTVSAADYLDEQFFGALEDYVASFPSDLPIDTTATGGVTNPSNTSEETYPLDTSEQTNAMTDDVTNPSNTSGDTNPLDTGDGFDELDGYLFDDLEGYVKNTGG